MKKTTCYYRGLKATIEACNAFAIITIWRVGEIVTQIQTDEIRPYKMMAEILRVEAETGKPYQG